MYPAQSLAVRWCLEWLREAGTGCYSTHSISTAKRQFKIKSILNWNPNIIAGLLSKLLLLIGHTSLCITLDLRRSDVGSWMSHIKCRMSNLRSRKKHGIYKLPNKRYHGSNKVRTPVCLFGVHIR